MKKLINKEPPLISMAGYANSSEELKKLIDHVEKEISVARLEMEKKYEG